MKKEEEEEPAKTQLFTGWAINAVQAASNWGL